MFNFLKRWKLNAITKKLKRFQQLREQGDKKAQVMEIQTLHELAGFYQKVLFNKNFPLARLSLFEAYRAAASLNDAKAQYQCALMAFAKAKFYQTWYQSSYGREIHEKIMRDTYQEAHAFLDAAEANHYVEAKRYKGLAYIYGWGVEKNVNQGFDLILESIEMENAWSNATKIIEKLHLNSPEFFKALTQYQAKKK